MSGTKRPTALLPASMLALLLSCQSAPPAGDHHPAPAGALRGASVTPPPAAIVRYDAIQHPVIGNAGMVVSQSALASRIGRGILAAGGNAVDASVAVGFALAVTLPRAGNLGGSGFMLIHLATGKTIALDFRSAGPAAFEPSRYLVKGSISTAGLRFGAHAAGVPGTVAGLFAAHQAHGRLPWHRLLQPAIDIAEQGIVVTEDLAFALGEARRVMARYPASMAAYFRPNNRAGYDNYAPGERLRQPDLAWSLRAIQRDGADAFYRGVIADRILAAMRDDRGLLSSEDLAGYRVRPRTVIETPYRGHRVLAFPPASGGGLALLQMLNVLSHFDVAARPHGSAASVHLLAEVMKRSAANRRQSLGDPDFVAVPIAGFLSEAIAKQLADAIDLETATPVATIDPFDASQFESRDTTHFSVVDSDGNAVATTYTLGYSFGSYYVVPGTGILLDNQLRNYSYNQPGHANAFAPGKRMLSTMTPTIVLDASGDVRLVTGTPGGSRIVNVILQVLVNVLDYDMNVAQATHALRIYQGWRTATLSVEPGFPPDTVRRLAAMGHVIKHDPTMGSIQSIAAGNGLLFGAADPRRPGAAAVGLDHPPTPLLRAR